MDIKDIRKIIEMMKQNELSEFELQDEGFRIAIKRRNGGDSQVVVSPGAGATHMMMPATMQPMQAAHAPAAAPAAAPSDEDDGLEKINSPMVGTFYRASAPDADPFASVGTEVDENSVVCIIEAMKVMNEIKAETRGVIRKILVDNSAPVQFGQALFLIEPA